jgi:hypothetical protein
MKTKVLIVGNPRETHVGRHLVNGAASVGIEAEIMDLAQAYQGPRWLKSLCWHLLGKRPQRLERFSRQVIDRIRDWQPDLLLTSGLAPLSAKALTQVRQEGVPAANFLTDDPWNKHHHTPWFMRSLPLYDHVFTPRRANMAELEALKGPQVHYLPFAYAPEVHFPPEPMTEVEHQRWKSEVLFIGGADEERAAMVRPLIDSGYKVDVWGGYWDRMSGFESLARGHAGPETFRQLVASAGVNLCLVRRANRDGHSMRTFELAAVGGCLAVEDTCEHREIFGRDGECVRFFRSTAELLTVTSELLADNSERQRLAAAVRSRLVDGGHHTYAARLQAITALCVPHHNGTQF